MSHIDTKNYHYDLAHNNLGDEIMFYMQSDLPKLRKNLPPEDLIEEAIQQVQKYPDEIYTSETPATTDPSKNRIIVTVGQNAILSSANYDSSKPIPGKLHEEII